MKLNEIADDVGLDVNGEALLARGEQLVKLEVRHREAVSVVDNKNFQMVIYFSAHRVIALHSIHS